MKKIINKEEMTRGWLLESWWQKALYIWGHINFWFSAAWVVIAILIAMSEF